MLGRALAHWHMVVWFVLFMQREFSLVYGIYIVYAALIF